MRSPLRTAGGPNKNTPISYSVTASLTQDSSSTDATGRRSKKLLAPALAPKSAPMPRSISSKVASPSSLPLLRTLYLLLQTCHRRCPIFKGSFLTAAKAIVTSPTSSAACKHPLMQSTTDLPEAHFRLLGWADRPEKFGQPYGSAVYSSTQEFLQVLLSNGTDFTKVDIGKR